MTLGAMIAMMRDQGVQDTDLIDTIIGYFDGAPATDFECKVWPGRGDSENRHRGKYVDFTRRRRDAL